MRTISGALKSALVGGKRAALVKLTPKVGAAVGYTDHDNPLTVDGQLYNPAPGLNRIMFSGSTDDKVSNQEFASAWVDATSIEQALLAGNYDNAEIEVAFCAWDDVGLGRLIIDRGNLGVIQWSEDGYRADVQSHMRSLQRNVNFVFTPTCRHLLFSAFSADKIGACTLNPASFTFTGSVSVIIVQKLKFSCTGFGQPTGYSSNGKLTWTSGNNNGLTFEVKKHTVGGTVDIELFPPTFANIQIGDNFSITAGCDKTLTTCKNKFNNVVNFGGFPHVQTEVMYR